MSLNSPTEHHSPIKLTLWKKISAAIFFIITVILCLLAILYSSPWGTQLTVKAVNQFTPLSFTYKKGMISESVEFSSLSYANKHIDVTAKDVILKFHLRCFLDKQLCIDSLVAKTLKIDIHPQPSKQKKTYQQVSLPFAIKAEQLSIAQTEIITNGKSINIDSFTSAIDFHQNIFSFEQTVATDLTIKTLEHVNNTSKDTSKSLLTYLQSIHLLTIPTLYLPIDLRINNLTLSTFSYEPILNQSPQLTLNNTALSGQWIKNSVKISSFLTEHKNLQIQSFNGELQTTSTLPIDINLQTKIKQNPVWPQISDSTQQLSVKGDFTSLTFNASSKETLVLTTEGTLELANPLLPYSISINAEKMPLYDEVSHVIHPSTISLTSQGNLKQQAISVDSVINGLGYKNAELIFQGNHATNEETTLVIDSFKLKDNKNDLDVAGNITISNKPTWNLRIKAKDFTLPKIDNEILGRNFTGNIKGTLNTQGAFDYENSTITVSNTNLSGVVNDVPFSAVGSLYLQENWQVEPSDLSISVFDSIVEVKGFNDTHWHIDGRMETPNIETYIPEVFGEAATTFSIRGPIKSPSIHFTNSLKDTVYQQISSPLVIAKGIYSPTENHKLSAQVTSEQLNTMGIPLNNFTGNINGDVNTQNLEFSWDGELNSALKVNGIWNHSEQQWVGKIAEAEVQYLDFKWLPNKTITTTYDHKKQTVSVNKHCWENEGLDLCLNKKVSFFHQGNIPLTLSMYTPIFNETFAPEDLLINTHVTGDVNIKWQQNKDYEINGDLTLFAGNILLEDSTLGLPVEILSAWDKGKVSFNVTNTDINTHLMFSPNKDNTLPFYSTLNIDSSIKRENDYPLSGTASLHNFNLAPFTSISPEIASLSGVINANMLLSGTLKTPDIQGKINFSDGELKLLRSPTLFKNGAVSVDLLGDHAMLSGTFSVDNDIALIKGDANWLADKWLNIDVNADQLSILVPPHVEATITPHINIHLTEQALRFSGDVSVVDGILEVNKLPEGSVELSKDVVFVDVQGKEIIKDSGFDINTNIRLFIDEEFQLSGQGFNGNLNGALLIQHGTHQPLQVFGNLNIPGGRYHAYGQRLQIEKGKVAFNGPTDNPHVNLRATRTIQKENIKVGVEISGQANSLVLNLISSPTMSRAQTLSYLLRGQGLDLDAPDNSGVGVALGAALANYSGILKQIEKLPLLNNVEIEGSSEQIAIAGYIGKKIYLKYGIGVEDPVNELTIRLFLMSRLWIETISGSGQEHSADIYYSFDTNL